MMRCYRITVDFACPSCHKHSRMDSVIETKSSGPDQTGKAIAKFPLECAVCQELAPADAGTLINLTPISQMQYLQWVGWHRDSLAVYTQREP